MPRALKFVLGAVVALVIIIGVALFALYAGLNDIIKAAIEEVGGQLTGTEVALDDVDVSLEDGVGELSGFRVVNPDGFSRDDAFSFDSVRVKIDTSTILSDIVVVNEVRVVKPEITYELAGDGDNLNTLKRDTQSNAERLKNEAGAGGSEPAAAGETEDGQKFIIERVYLTDGVVNVKATQLTDRRLSVPLPDVELQDIGKDEGGADPAAIAGEVMNGLLDKITNATDQIDVTGLLKDVGAAAEELADDAAQAAGDAVDAVGEGASDAADAVSEGASDAVDGAGDAVKDAGDAVKGLFGN